MQTPENMPAYLLALTTALGLTLALPSVSSAEEAADQPPRPYADTPCAEDSERMCAQHKFHRGISNCLRTAKKRGIPGPTSEACNSYLDEERARQQAAAAASYKEFLAICDKEINQFCKEYAHNRQALVGCLSRSDSTQYSPECNAKRPRRNPYAGSFRFRDGSEPKDWDEQLEKKNRPRAYQRSLKKKELEEARAKAAAIKKAHADSAADADAAKPDAADGGGASAEAAGGGSGESGAAAGTGGSTTAK